jgi:hypothetical protein
VAHPVHEILRRFLGSEQFAFGAEARELWPWERRDAHEPDPDESDDEEPTQFDDVYPWLEPAS